MCFGVFFIGGGGVTHSYLITISNGFRSNAYAYDLLILKDMNVFIYYDKLLCTYVHRNPRSIGYHILHHIYLSACHNMYPFCSVLCNSHTVHLIYIAHFHKLEIKQNRFMTSILIDGENNFAFSPKEVSLYCF